MVLGKTSNSTRAANTGDDTELSCATTFRNVLGQVIKRARGLLFYRASRRLKKMVSFGGGRSAEFKRPSQRIFLSWEADRSCYTGLSGTCALVIIPPPTIETLRIALHCWFLQLVKTSSFYRRYKLFRVVLFNFIRLGKIRIRIR